MIPVIFLYNISISERTLSEIRRRDRRSCEPTRLLFMTKQKLEKAISSSMNACLRKLKKNENLTADQVLDSNKLNDIFRQDDGFKSLK